MKSNLAVPGRQSGINKVSRSMFKAQDYERAGVSADEIQ